MQKKIFRASVEDRTFDEVVTALGGGMANVSSGEAEEVAYFLAEHGLWAVPHLFMAINSIGGREWALRPGRKPAFYAEPCFNGGWLVLVEDDVEFVQYISATSGSRLTAKRDESVFSSGWTVTLEVPIQDGRPYKGYYWKCFYGAFQKEEIVIE